MARVTAVLGDITRQEVDAIVNAANQRMLGGGGVDGAIHRAAGPELLEACRSVPEVRPGVRCPTGEARITPGFRLPARHVIHTVGPVYSGSDRDAELLTSAHRASLDLGIHHRLETIAFPAISCGVYGYPPEKAAPIAVAVAREYEWELAEIRFVLFSEDLLAVWKKALEAP
jgi:O-acetyl-ADP-ribose deacetylase (regulator of RNase III)